MKNPFESREIWFLTGSQDLYGEDVVEQVADQSRTIVATLDDAAEIPVRIGWKPELKERDGIRRIALEANADDACVGVNSWLHTFSPANPRILGLDAHRNPLLPLHT